MRLLTLRPLFRCIRSIQSTAYIHILVIMVLGVIHGTMEYRLPEYNDTPTNVTYYKGDRAVLPCSVRHLGTKEVIWKKLSDDHVLTVGDFVFVDETNFDIDHHGRRDEDWNLIIRDVQPEHSGLYECQISTKEDLQRHIQLNVLDSHLKQPGGIRIDGPDFVEKGNRIVLTCNATGELLAPEDIDWFKDGIKLKEDQYQGITIVKFRVYETKTLHSQLEIEHSDMPDSGNYICRSSELLITSKNVMVLNDKRSKTESYQNGQDYSLAETNPNKRDYPPEEEKDSASGSYGCGVTVYSRDVFLVHIACILAFILQYHSSYH